MVKEDIQNVGAREDEAFDQSESAMASPDGKAQTRRRKKHELYLLCSTALIRMHCFDPFLWALITIHYHPSRVTLSASPIVSSVSSFETLMSLSHVIYREASVTHCESCHIHVILPESSVAIPE